MRVFIKEEDHELLKGNYFHQDYEDTTINGNKGILITDTSWYLYASMHLNGQARLLPLVSYKQIQQVELNGSIPQVTDDPHRQPPRAPLISDVNKKVGRKAADAIRKCLADEGIFLEEAQLGEIIVETIKRTDDLLDADGYEVIHNHVQDEIGW